MLSLCMYVKFVCVEAGGAGGGAGGGEGARDTESKTRTPHKVVGKKLHPIHSYIFQFIRMSSKKN